MQMLNKYSQKAISQSAGNPGDQILDDSPKFLVGELELRSFYTHSNVFSLYSSSPYP